MTTFKDDKAGIAEELATFVVKAAERDEPGAEELVKGLMRLPRETLLSVSWAVRNGIEMKEQLAKLREVNWREGEGLRLNFGGEAVGVMAYALADMMKEHGADNVVEVVARHPEMGPIVLTVQRKEGKTPMDLRREQVERADELADALRELHGAAAESWPDRTCVERAGKVLEEHGGSPDEGRERLKNDAVKRAIRRLRGADDDTWAGLLAELDASDDPADALHRMGLMDEA